MKNVIRLFISIMVVVMLSGCGDGRILIVWGEPEPYVLALTVTNVSANSATLSLTSNFNCVDCSVYRNDVLYTHVSTQAFVPAFFIVSNSPACYRAGDFLSPLGWIWSNEVCV